MFKIEITADTLSALGQKLVAAGVRLQGVPTTEEAPAPAPVEQSAPEKKAPAKKTPAKKAPEPVEEVAEEVAEEAAPALDFDKDVAPLVMKAVSTKNVGKPAVVALLEEFDAQRASDVSEDNWADLVARLGDLIADAS